MKDNMDLDFLKNKIEEENIQPPAELDAQGVKSIIYPQQPKRIQFSKSRGFKVGVTIAACLVAFIAVGIFAAPRLFGDRTVNVDNDSDISEALPTFTSYAELEKMVKKANKNESGSLNFSIWDYNVKDGDMAVEESAPAGANTTGDVASTYSETNIQVEGVDEADILKNDGKYIYYVSQYNSNTVKIYEPKNGDAELVSEITDFEYTDHDEYFDYDVYYGFDDGDRIQDIFVYGDKLVVNTNSGYSSDEYFNTYVYDLSDIKNPALITSFSQSGHYVSSRMVGSQLYAVSEESYYFIDKNRKSEDYAPKCGENGNLDSMPLECIRYVQNGDESSNSFLIISSINIEACEKTTETQAIFGMSADIYCNENTMYTASYLNYEYEQSEIFKINLSPDSIEFAAHTVVDGCVNNQFSMDEYNGYFRIAVTKFDYGYGSGESKHENLLYVFDENLKEVGRIDSFARGESIKSVRFMGDVAYVITYEDIDPLFVIDLSDPESPEILGEVKITGFSSQLIPVDENTLLGIGYDTVPSGFENMEKTDGIKLVLFDVSDKSNPKVLDTAVFASASSKAQMNHKAVAIDRTNGRYAIDYTSLEDHYVYDAETDDYTYSDYQHIGAITFEVRDGKILVTNEFKEKSENYYVNASRCTFMNDYVYVLDEEGSIYPFEY